MSQSLAASGRPNLARDFTPQTAQIANVLTILFDHMSHHYSGIRVFNIFHPKSPEDRNPNDRLSPVAYALISTTTGSSSFRTVLRLSPADRKENRFQIEMPHPDRLQRPQIVTISDTALTRPESWVIVDGPSERNGSLQEQLGMVTVEGTVVRLPNRSLYPLTKLVHLFARAYKVGRDHELTIDRAERVAAVLNKYLVGTYPLTPSRGRTDKKGRLISLARRVSSKSLQA